MRVLLVEDSPGDADLVGELLAGTPTQIDHVTRLGDACQLLVEESFEVALLDLGLPDGDGLGVLAKVQETDPELAIIVITGLDDEEIGLRAVRSGAEDYLVKGKFDSELLLRAMRHAVERHHAHKQLRQLLSLNPDGVVVVDGEGVIVFLNAAAASLFNTKPNDLLGETFGFPVADGEGTEIQIRGERVVEMRVVEVEWQGESAYLAALRDITPRKQAEEVLRKLNAQLQEANEKLQKLDEAKSRLISNTSHEFRTPLNAINNYTQLLQEEIYGPLNEKQRNAVSGLTDCTQHLLQMINDLLDLSKIEAGELEVNFEEVDLAAECRAAAETAQAGAAPGALRVSLDLASELPVIHTDPRCLKQILLNLLGNALKFTEQGQVQLGVRRDASGETLTLSVSDTGIGISESDLENIFEPFRQADDSATRKFGGAGLGLNITRRLLELLGGRIEATSRKGKGSTFTVTLPIDGRAHVDEESSVTRRGALKELSLANLLHSLYVQGKTGLLSLERGETVKVVHLLNGYPVWVDSTLEEETLGVCLLHDGKISKEVLDRSRRMMEETGRKLGEVLLEIEAVSSNDLFIALKGHLQLKIVSCFAWDTGEYAFREHSKLPNDSPAITLEPGRLIIDGIRRHFQGRDLDELHSFDTTDCILPAKDQAYTPEQLALSSSEQRIYQLACSGCTIDEIAGQEGSTEEVLQLLTALHRLDIIRFSPSTPETLAVH